MSELRTGYDPDFLGTEYRIEMPVPGLEIEGDILKREGLRDGFITDYIHYSVIMSESTRQALVSVANLDQNELQVVEGRDWFIDPRIGEDNQIGEEAYASNCWDRGHLTRRTAVTWGSKFVAKKASNDSCSFANSCLQHENFNRDEWRVPEEIVHHMDRDVNGRITVMTGPVFTSMDRWYTRNRWSPNRTLEGAVRIPSGFWKIIAYVGRESLECQSYVMYQHAPTFEDRRGRRSVEMRNHQVTITEIEQLTGLEFDEILFEKNPLYYYARKGINKEPEAFAAPKSTAKRDMDTGVVFTRKEAESSKFRRRKRKAAK